MKVRWEIPIADNEQIKHIQRAYEELVKAGVVVAVDAKSLLAAGLEPPIYEDLDVGENGRLMIWDLEHSLAGAFVRVEMEKGEVVKREEVLIPEAKKIGLKCPIRVGDLHKLNIETLKELRATIADAVFDSKTAFILVDCECRSQIVKRWRRKKEVEAEKHQDNSGEGEKER